MTVLIDFASAGRDRASVVEAMRRRGVGSQVHYIPVHRQPYYAQRYGALDLPGAEAWYARALSLPLYPAMTEMDVARAVSALGDALQT
jgi:dTDP-4-amino-4,6-dideoxygalactose transaminase